MQRFGEKLRRLRKRHGLTQKELAQELGIAAQSFINALETGKKQPSVEVLVKISRLFQVSMDQLAKDELEIADL